MGLFRKSHNRSADDYSRVASAAAPVWQTSGRARQTGPQGFKVGSLEFGAQGQVLSASSLERVGMGELIHASPAENADLKANHVEPGVLAGDLANSMRRIEEKFSNGEYDAAAMPLIEDYLDELKNMALIQAKREALHAKRVSDVKEANAAAYKAVTEARNRRAAEVDSLHRESEERSRALWGEFDASCAERKARKKALRLERRERRDRKRALNAELRDTKRAVKLARRAQEADRKVAEQKVAFEARIARRQRRAVEAELEAQRRNTAKAQKAEREQMENEASFAREVQNMEEAHAAMQMRVEAERKRAEEAKAAIAAQAAIWEQSVAEAQEAAAAAQKATIESQKAIVDEYRARAEAQREKAKQEAAERVAGRKNAEDDGVGLSDGNAAGVHNSTSSPSGRLSRFKSFFFGRSRANSLVPEEDSQGQPSSNTITGEKTEDGGTAVSDEFEPNEVSVLSEKNSEGDFSAEENLGSCEEDLGASSSGEVAESSEKVESASGVAERLEEGLPGKDDQENRKSDSSTPPSDEAVGPDEGDEDANSAADEFWFDSPNER